MSCMVSSKAVFSPKSEPESLSRRGRQCLSNNNFKYKIKLVKSSLLTLISFIGMYSKNNIFLMTSLYFLLISYHLFNLILQFHIPPRLE